MTEKGKPSRRAFLGGMLGACAATTFSGLRALAAGGRRGADVAAFVSPPMLGRVTRDSATINLVSDGIVSARARWTPSDAALDSSSSVSRTVTADAPHVRLELPLDGLAPDRDYVYRVEHASEGSDWEALSPARFRTARSPGREFEFAIVADGHWGSHRVPLDGPRRWTGEQCLRQIRDHRSYDFLVDLGDSPHLAGARTEADALERYFAWRRLMGELTPELPVYLVLGNHEREAGFFQRGGTGRRIGNRLRPGEFLQKWSTGARLLCVPNPRGNTYPEGGEGAPGFDTREEWTGSPGPWSDAPLEPLQNFYAWTWGDALFVVLDPFRYTLVGEFRLPSTPSEWTLGVAQRLWLEETLAKSTARWKIVFCHHLVGGGEIEPGGKRLGETENVAYGRGSGREANRPGTEQAEIHRLMRRHGAQFFVYGHDHLFCHSTLDDVHYVCCGRPTFLNRWLDRDGMRDSYGDVVRQGRDRPWIRALYNVLGYTRFRVGPEAIGFEWVRTGYSFVDDLARPGDAIRDWRESWAGLAYDVEAGGVIRLNVRPTDVDAVRTVSGATVERFGVSPSGEQYWNQPVPIRPESHASEVITVSDFPEHTAVVDTVPEVFYRFSIRG